jgi:glycosyltransferase involved in cell wall biosynthesis
MSQTKITIAVTNDLYTDQRVHRVASTLTATGASVELIGRLLPNSKPLGLRAYRTVRLKLIFTRGPLFYFFYNLRLFLYLLFKKTNMLISNDLDTLPACFILSKIKPLQLIYDSHEYFTEVPELLHRRLVRSVWLTLEKWIVPRVKFAYTVCDSLSEIYQSKYGTPFITIRNLPYKKLPGQPPAIHSKLKAQNIIVYQGALNLGRGIEKVIKSMPFLENTLFMVIGRGDIQEELDTLVISMKLENRVIFTGSIPFEQLHAYTQMAHLGISLEENMGKNYYYALPNKIFDYIQARIPILSSAFPEMEKIINGKNLGMTTSEEDPEKLAKTINTMLTDSSLREMWQENLAKASKELCWENEEKKMLSFYYENNLLQNPS